MLIACPEQSDTERLAECLARTSTLGMVLYLHGELGAGKSTFARAYLHALGVTGSIKSPTYSLIEVYGLNESSVTVHMDLYRIAAPDEVQYFALDELMPRLHTMLIEWPDNGEGFIPDADMSILFTHASSGRELHFTAHTKHAEQWLNAMENAL